MRISALTWGKLVRISPDQVRQARENAWGMLMGNDNEGLTELHASRLASLDYDSSGHDAVYCSPAFRCKETARCLRLPPYIEEPRIVERRFGVFDGLSVSEVQERYPEEFEAFRKLDAGFTIPGGESRAEHFARVEEWLVEISQKYHRVLAVTHGGTIDFLYRLGTDGVLHGGEAVYAGPNAGLSIFEVSWPDVPSRGVRGLAAGLRLFGAKPASQHAFAAVTEGLSRSAVLGLRLAPRVSRMAVQQKRETLCGANKLGGRVSHRIAVLLWAAVALPVSVQAQDPAQYEERSRGLVTISTPNGPVEVRSEHDATIAIERIAADTLRAWYEALDVASINPFGESRPPTADALGQHFVLHESEDGRLRAVETPNFPAAIADITDLTLQFFDFFPTRPDAGYEVGAEWIDTTHAPAAARPNFETSAQKITRYHVEAEAQRDGIPTFLMRAEADLALSSEGPLPDQPGLRVRSTMTGTESNTFWVAKDDGRLIERMRTGDLRGEMEYIGGPQPIALPMTRVYENSITLVGS